MSRPERVRVFPAAVRGTLPPPPSKSAAHRALLCGALAGSGRVRGIIDSDDMRATLGALPALGVRAERRGGTVEFFPAGDAEAAGQPPVVDCGESGSTLRFLMPVFAARGIPATFTGRGRLPARPLGVYAGVLPRLGVTLSTAAGLPLTLGGRLRAGAVEMPGDVSSQFLSGLFFALPLCPGDSEIRLTSPLESAAYADMTRDALAGAGVEILPAAGGFRVPGGQTYRPRDAAVEGDWSQAAFLLVMGALAGDVTVTGLNPDSRQGDRAAAGILRRMGADLTETPGGLRCRRSPLRGARIDASQIPDLVPVLAVAAALAEGETRITGAARLRLKESDRLAAMAENLRRLGASVEEQPDGLRILGRESLPGGVFLPGFNDHRIVMSMAVAALRCDRPVEIGDAGSVAKSWPGFFEAYQSCGGAVDVV